MAGNPKTMTMMPMRYTSIQHCVWGCTAAKVYLGGYSSHYSVLILFIALPSYNLDNPLKPKPVSYFAARTKNALRKDAFYHSYNL